MSKDRKSPFQKPSRTTTTTALIKVFCADLRLGMYVSELDRPWLETPFIIQGFELTTPDQIEKLCDHCEYVYIDNILSLPTAVANLKTNADLSPKLSKPSVKRQQKALPKVHYENTMSFRQELPRAKQVFDGVRKSYQDFFSQSDRKIALDIPRLKRVVAPMVDSIIRNPNASIWLTRMQSGDDYTFQHSLGCSVWCVVLGRQLGIPKAELSKLSLGGLLMDLGKTRIEASLLSKPGKLTPEEFKQVQRHVALGIAELKSEGNVELAVLDMVAYHHERFDGSGYPGGLKNTEIPLFARIGAIADCYDAMTNNRPYAKAKSPTEAIKIIYELRGTCFQAEMVEEFIQAIGLYPAGTVVELSSGEIAIVVASSPTRRLHPKVMILLDANREPVSESSHLDLMDHKDECGQPVNIVKSLDAKSINIDMAGMGI